MIVTMTQTEDEGKDLALYDKVVEIIREFSGKDEVHLRLILPDQIKNMKMKESTDITPDLKKRLGQVVGTENVKTENITTNTNV